MTRIAVLCSGGGTNLQALIDAQSAGRLAGGVLVLVAASNPEAYALTRAKRNGIPTVVVSPKDYPAAGDYDSALLEALKGCRCDLVVLAGFLRILGPRVLAAYEDRILNIHPSLIPAFCGKGMYGLHVHKAALDYGVKVTGATVHLVNRVVDGGRILLQKAVEVREDDTPQTLQARVMEQAEQVLLPRAVAMYCRGEILTRRQEKEEAPCSF